MTTKVTKVRNGSIPIPGELRKAWRGVSICIFVSGDTMTIKRMNPPTLSELRPKLEAIGKMISQKDIDTAVREVRRKARRKNKR